MSGDSPPLVSFLIVTYNAGPYLRECLESVRRQTYSNIEVIVVDNASTDGSTAGLEAQPGLKLVSSASNLGPSWGAVLGLPHCRGEFIARMDADDIALPERIEEQVRHLKDNPGRDAVGADVVRINATGRPWALGLSLRSEFLRRRASKWDIACMHTSLLVRRSVAQDRFYNPTLFTAGDFEWIEWIARRGRLGIVPRILCLYRQHDFSITRRLRRLQRLSSCELRMRLSAAANRDDLRGEIARKDFSFLLNDPRLKIRDYEQARVYESACRRNSDWLGAAYFASIGRRWTRVPYFMLRAAAAGRSQSELAAFALCRTAWPIWRRFQNAAFKVMLLSSGPMAGAEAENIQATIRLARRFNRMK